MQLPVWKAVEIVASVRLAPPTIPQALIVPDIHYGQNSFGALGPLIQPVCLVVFLCLPRIRGCVDVGEVLAAKVP